MATSDYPSGFSVELAQPQDLALVQAILLERCRWLAQKRIEQWPPGGFADEVVSEAIDERTVYIARVGKEIAGTIALRDEDALWGDQPLDSAYIRRMATHRSWDGRGIGAAMAEWARAKALEENKQYLRLSCVTGDGSLPAYYKSLGFESVGERTGDFPSVVLMQQTLLFDQ